MTSSQPPGWYPDATLPGYERWWDGGAWSPVTRPIGDLAAPSAPGSGDPQSYSQGGGHASPTTPSSDQPAQGWGAPSGPGWGAPAEPAANRPAAPAYGQPQGSPYGQPADSPYGQPTVPTEQTAGTPYGAPAGTPYGAPAPSGEPLPPPAGYPAYPQYPQGQYPQGQYPQGGEYPGAPYGYPIPDGGLASRGLRLLARIIDGILTGIVTVVLGLPFLRQIVRAVSDFADSVPADGSTPDTAGLLSNGDFTGGILRFTLVAALVGAAYHVTLIALRGATVGKSVVGVKVKPVDGEGNPTWAQAALRWVTTDVPTLIPNVGIFYWLLDSLWCLWDGKRQCLHDKLPKTVVVRSR